MIAIDREPVANIIQSASLSEDFIGGSASPIVPEAFNKAFTSEPLDFLHPIKRLTLPIGRNRLFPKLTLESSRTTKDYINILQYKRRGRGPCPGCMANTQEGHHWGSKCTKRGVSTFVSRIRMGNHVPQIPQNAARGGMRLRRTGVIV